MISLANIQPPHLSAIKQNCHGIAEILPQNGHDILQSESQSSPGILFPKPPFRLVLIKSRSPSKLRNQTSGRPVFSIESFARRSCVCSSPLPPSAFQIARWIAPYKSWQILNFHTSRDPERITTCLQTFACVGGEGASHKNICSTNEVF